MTRPLVSLLVLALWACSAPSHAAAPVEAAKGSPAGDWAGWGYLDEGGDLPLRFHVVEGKDGTWSATLDSPAQRLAGLPIGSTNWNAPRLRLERVTEAGAALVFEAVLDGDSLAGTMEFGGATGRFEVSRSPLALPDVPADEYADCTGSYRFDDGSALIVGRRFWGELLYTDLDSGRQGTLFALGDDRFFAGSAMYVPGPVSARARFERNGAGEVVGLDWAVGDGAPRRAERSASVEEPLAFQRDGVHFSGSVIRPPGPGPFPGIVVLGGSNWDVRGSIRRDAEIYAALGLAALIYDKRGYGESGGQPTVPFETTARDAAAALEALARRPDVRDEAVGLVGTSRGGWFAPLAASLSDRAAFLVLVVAPAVSPAEQETTRRLGLLRADGADAKRIGAARQALEQAWRFARTGRDFQAYLAARNAAVAAGVPDTLLETDQPDPDAWRWMRLNMHYDPLPALRRVRVPLLALYGAADRNVVAADNERLLRRALAAGGNRDVEIHVLPGADHGLRPAPPGGALPLHRMTGFVPERWKLVRTWLARWTGRGATSSSR